MTYSKGGKFISIEINDLLGGRKPGLYIGTPNQLLKVASFASYEKANIFREYLEYMFGGFLVHDSEVKQDVNA